MKGGLTRERTLLSSSAAIGRRTQYKLQGSHVAYAGSGTDQVISRVDRASAVNGPKVRSFKDIKGKSIAEN